MSLHVRRRMSHFRRRTKRHLFVERLEDRLLLTAGSELFRSDSPSFAPGEILIGFEDGRRVSAEVAQLLQDLSPAASSTLQTMRAHDGTTSPMHLKLAEDTNILALTQQLSQMDGVAYAEPNYLVSIALIPNDARFSDLWGMHNTGQTGGTSDADIDAPQAWDIQTGSLQIVVGVIDTGIDYRHPDLYKNVWLNQGELALVICDPIPVQPCLTDIDSDALITFYDLNSPLNSNHVTDVNNNGYIDGGDLLNDPFWEDGSDADLNGYVDDLIGWNFVSNDNDPFDDNSHGSHVSGTIGGMGNNSIGVAGVNWQVQLMGLKFLDSNGDGSLADAIDAIDYATIAGANLTSNSWGGGGFSQGIFDAIQASGDSNSLFIAAAGNDGSNNDQFASYPASYNLDNIIAVAATDHDDLYAGFSNHGATTVDLAAPGVSTLSTTPNGGYSTFSGTSMATPHVSGAVALLWSHNGSLSNSAVKQAILDGVDVLADTSKTTLTNGRLNVFNALGSLEDDSIPPADVDDLAVTGSTLSTVGLTWTATGDDGLEGTASAYDVRFSTSEIITEADWAAASQATGEPTPQAPLTTESFIVGGLQQDTGYYFALKVRDNVGNYSNISNVVLGSTAVGTVVFEDDMESGPGAWIETGLWHQSSHQSNSPTTAWYYGQESVWDYDTGTANSGTLTSQAIDLSTTDEAILTYFEWSEVESDTGYDRTRLQLSSDGTTWTTVLESHGTSNAWVSRTVSLADYVGGTVQLRYWFDTIDEVFNTFEGWYIDDVKVIAAGSVPDVPAIIVTPTTGLQTTEAGGQASFTVILATQPTDTVTIDISSTDMTEGAVSTSQLSFGTGDWNQAQTVTVTGLDDPESPSFVDGDIAYTIVTAPAVSDDSDYNNLNASDVSVTNLDLDTPLFQIEHGVVLSVSSTGSTVQLDNSYTSPVVITTPNYGSGGSPAVVRLDNVTGDSFDIHVVSPTGAAISGVNVHYVVVEAGAYSLPGGIQLEAFTFESSIVDRKNAWTGHTRSFENTYAQPVVLGQVMSSNDPDWSVFWSSGTSSRTAPPSGTEFQAGLHVGEDPNTTRASETIGYLVLNVGSGELNGIAFEVGVGADIVRGMDNSPPFTYSLTSLSAPETAVVSQVAMDGNDGSWALLYGDTPLGAASIQIAADEDQLNDSERSHTTEQMAYIVFEQSGPVPGVTIQESDGSTDVDEDGTTDTYDVVLDTVPTEKVMIIVSGDGQVNGSPALLTFMPGNWDIPQTVTVMAQDDDVAEGSHNGTVSHLASSGDPGYDGISISNVIANITDNDTAGVTITQSSGTTNVSEDGATDDYTVVLNSQPTANVTISIGGDGQVVGAPTSLVFTAADWDQAQTVTVMAVDDDVAEANHVGSISHSSSSGDANYNVISIANVTANITDNDSAGVVVTESGGSTNVVEGGATDTYTVVLTSEPTANVSITVSGDGQASGAPTPLVFTAGNWASPQIVTVSAVDDGIIEGDHSGLITHTVASGDGSYSGISIASVTANITDDDVAGVTITESGGSTDVSEAGGTDTYSVVLDAAPVEIVTISVNVDLQVNATPSSLMFTPANWFVSQIVTVSAVDDSDVEGNHSGAITHAAASDDPLYAGIAINGVTANITDNDEEATGPALEYGVVSNVNGNWMTINLGSAYTSMVVVASVNYGDGDNPMVTRIRNASAGSSFEVRVQRPNNGAVPSSGFDVHYFVVEEGVYTLAADGIHMEAVKYNSTVTDRRGSWVGQSRSYSNTYANPVVIGQVMTDNDSDWSVFWARGGSRQSIPSATTLFVGKHVAEDTDTSRVAETVGYVVFETGSGTVGEINYQAAVGSDTIRGTGNSPPYSYALSGSTLPQAAVVSEAAIDGNNGAWPVLYGADPLSPTSLNLAIEEDQIRDSERIHTHEQVAYIVFEQTEIPPPPLQFSGSSSVISATTPAQPTAAESDVTLPRQNDWHFPTSVLVIARADETSRDARTRVASFLPTPEASPPLASSSTPGMTPTAIAAEDLDELAHFSLVDEALLDLLAAAHLQPESRHVASA